MLLYLTPLQYVTYLYKILIIKIVNTKDTEPLSKIKIIHTLKMKNLLWIKTYKFPNNCIALKSFPGSTGTKLENKDKLIVHMYACSVCTHVCI